MPIAFEIKQSLFCVFTNCQTYCLLDAESKDYCKECTCKERKEPETCEISPRNLGDSICDDRANIEACEFDKGDCCLLDIESKEFCKECLCKESKESKPEDSKYTRKYCGRRPGERDTSFSFTNGASISPTKVNTKIRMKFFYPEKVKSAS